MFSSLINVDELDQIKHKNDLCIIDTRYDLANLNAGKEAWSESHIPNALFADIHDDLSGEPVTDCGRHPMLSEQAMQALFERLGISNSSQVVVYDDSFGAFAGRLWWMLRYMGHEQVAVLNGGWRAWINAGYELSDSHAVPKGASFTPNVQSDRLVLVDEVPMVKALFDSREPPRYRGEIEPIDPIAGHIPSAVNRFWQENLNKELGLFKSAEVLAEEFLSLFNGNNPSEQVFYCGSGVTACHNILAVSHAGLDMPKLYAGSWSEWCSDPNRPVETSES